MCRTPRMCFAQDACLSGAEGRRPEFFSCPGMRKTGWELQVMWAVMWLWTSSSVGAVVSRGEPRVGLNTIGLWELCGCRMRVHVDAKEILYFLSWSSALQNRQRPLDPIEWPPIFHRPCNFFLFLLTSAHWFILNWSTYFFQKRQIWRYWEMRKPTFPLIICFTS